MANLLNAINSNPLAGALSGTQRMSVGGGTRIPKFGSTVAAAGTKSPTPGGKVRSMAPGLTPKVAPTVQNMLSRPKRTRRSGYSKTSPSAAGSSAAAGTNSAGPGTGGY